MVVCHIARSFSLPVFPRPQRLVIPSASRRVWVLSSLCNYSFLLFLSFPYYFLLNPRPGAASLLYEYGLLHRYNHYGPDVPVHRCVGCADSPTWQRLHAQAN